MWTDRRLTDAYHGARVESIDADSRYVLISDCHRGAGNLSDEFTRNENAYLHALSHYLRHGYTYIEVGDGDELWEHPEFRQIKDAHFDAFEAIERFFDKGRYIRLWGNHDSYLSRPAYVAEHYFTYYHDHTRVTSDFLAGIEPSEALVLRDDESGQEFLVVHGHQGDFANDQAWFVTMLSVRHFWRHLRALGVKNPSSPARNSLKRHTIEKNYDRWIAEHKMALICGHTHRLKYPRTGELPYFNTGSCIYPTSITAIEIAGRAIQLVRWRVVADAEGVLRVTRQVLRGPDPLARFDIR